MKTPNENPNEWRAALDRAIQVFGGSQTDLSRAIGGNSPQLVHNWLRRGRVPAEWCPAIEGATNRAVTCEELRPDVRWHVLRDKSC